MFRVKISLHGKRVEYDSNDSWTDTFNKAVDKYGPCISIVILNQERL